MKIKTWRAIWAGIVLLFLIAGAIGAPALAQSGTVVKVIPAAANINAGETVDVMINVENVANLFGVELLVTFDPNLLEVVDANPSKAGVQVAAGDLLSPDFEAANEVTGGQIDYALTQIAPHAPVSGNGTLIRITFKGKANGASAITLGTVLLADQNGSNITSTSQNGTLTVGGTGPDPTATPMPTSTPGPTTEPTTPTPTPYPTVTPYYTPTPQPGINCSPVQGYHIVKPGETIYAIGRAYATRPQAIATCNNLVNPSNIHVSNRLAIPVAPWVPVPPGPTAARQFLPGQPPTTGCRYTHVIRPGETLLWISCRYGVSMWAIAQANNIYNPNLIYAGRTLCIP